MSCDIAEHEQDRLIYTLHDGSTIRLNNSLCTWKLTDSDIEPNLFTLASSTAEMGALINTMNRVMFVSEDNFYYTIESMLDPKVESFGPSSKIPSLETCLFIQNGIVDVAISRLRKLVSLTYASLSSVVDLKSKESTSMAVPGKRYIYDFGLIESESKLIFKCADAVPSGLSELRATPEADSVSFGFESRGLGQTSENMNGAIERYGGSLYEVSDKEYEQMCKIMSSTILKGMEVILQTSTSTSDVHSIRSGS